MWNNLISLREVAQLARRLAREPALARGVLARLPLTGRGRVEAAWAHTESLTRQWWDIPAVVARWNRMISGDPACPPHRYVLEKHLRGREPLTALSLGCGDGTKEMEWATTGAFRAIEAWDLSAQRIASAREEAASRGLDRLISFEVGDVHALPMAPGAFDLVLADHALHHFTPLEPLLRRIHAALAQDGVFVVNEFVGPSRFQWTDRQMAAANELLARFPDRYRTLAGSRHTRLPVIRPSRLGMMLRDPSEAVESARIMELLPRVFDVKEVRGYGGAVLHLLFAGIAHHFMDPDAEAQRLLTLAFETEDALIARGEVGHDFVLAVCGRRTEG